MPIEKISAIDYAKFNTKLGGNSYYSNCKNMKRFVSYVDKSVWKKADKFEKFEDKMAESIEKCLNSYTYSDGKLVPPRKILEPISIKKQFNVLGFIKR